MRNPWKFSFDHLNGSLWIADVGQNEIEEINSAPTTSAGGENYGWRCFEGSEPFNTSDCPIASTLTFPVAEYTHIGNGLPKCSITGGYVYRGTSSPNLIGNYVFADYCSTEMATLDDTSTIRYFGPFDGGVTSLGEDINNELYAAISSTGTIYNVVDRNTLNIKDNTIANEALYPNPAKNRVTFDYLAFTKTTQLNIYNLAGELVQTELIQNKTNTFSVKNLSAGIYIARIANSNRVLKLIVQ